MNDLYSAYNFKLKIDGIDDKHFHFTKCSAIKVSVNKESYREAGNNQIIQQIPTQIAYDDITLSYGMTDSRKLWGWLMKAVEGNVERKNVTLIIMGSDGKTAREQWKLLNASPVSWQGAEMDASSNSLAIAQLTLTFDSLERANGS